jgi:hypothetical protein
VDALSSETGVNRTYMSRSEKWDSSVGLEMLAKSVLQVEFTDFLKVPRKNS